MAERERTRRPTARHSSARRASLAALFAGYDWSEDARATEAPLVIAPSGVTIPSTTTLAPSTEESKRRLSLFSWIAYEKRIAQRGPTIPTRFLLGFLIFGTMLAVFGKATLRLGQG